VSDEPYGRRARVGRQVAWNRCIDDGELTHADILRAQFLQFFCEQVCEVELFAGARHSRLIFFRLCVYLHVAEKAVNCLLSRRFHQEDGQ